jgi:Uma2 family endonuclease
MHIDLEPPYLIIKPGVSEEDFYRLADEDSDWEYLDGRIVMHSPASNRHEALFAFLLTLLTAYVGERGGGEVRGSRYPMWLDPHWSPEPDILVVSSENVGRMQRQFLDGPADLALEIASESDPRLDLREKLPRYQAAGIPEIWLINPFERVVQAERKAAAGYDSIALPAGRLSSTVVPGFWIEIDWLWEEKLPATLACLRSILA